MGGGGGTITSCLPGYATERKIICFVSSFAGNVAIKFKKPQTLSKYVVIAVSLGSTGEVQSQPISDKTMKAWTMSDILEVKNYVSS